MMLHVPNFRKTWSGHTYENTRCRTCLDQLSTTFHETTREDFVVCVSAQSPSGLELVPRALSAVDESGRKMLNQTQEKAPYTLV